MVILKTKIKERTYKGKKKKGKRVILIQPKIRKQKERKFKSIVARIAEEVYRGPKKKLSEK